MGKLARLMVIAAVASPLLAATGCVPHRQEAYVWGPGEQTYYVQWEDENHRQHRDWNARSDADHKAYWKWRKHHGPHDHDNH